MMRAVKYWALAGASLPVAILVVTWFQGGVFGWPYLGLLLWPSSVVLVATYEREFTHVGIFLLALSIAINVVLYSYVGSILWRITRWLAKRQ